MQAESMFSKPQKFWTQNREASLDWLALGLLLAAWNATDGGDDLSIRRRPDAARVLGRVRTSGAATAAQIR